MKKKTKKPHEEREPKQEATGQTGEKQEQQTKPEKTRAIREPGKERQEQAIIETTIGEHRIQLTQKQYLKL